MPIVLSILPPIIDPDCKDGRRMELQELAERTGIPLRTLRYVVDSRLLPGLEFEIAEREAGRPRRLAKDVAFGVACAGVLLYGGVRRATTHFFMASVLDLRHELKTGMVWSGHEIISNFLEIGQTGQARLGDGVNVRLQFATTLGNFDTHWLESGHSKLPVGYCPKLLIDLIRSAVCADSGPGELDPRPTPGPG
jgi:hypothetical protein